MAFDDNFWRALADYGVSMPTLGTDSALWLAEYNRVRQTAFASVLITANASEGGSGSGLRQFPQEVLLDALHCHRFELDPTYVLPRHLALYPSAAVSAAFGDGGLTVRFSP